MKLQFIGWFIGRGRNNHKGENNMMNISNNVNNNGKTSKKKNKHNECLQ
jgi:hypothetical protein